MTGPVVASVWPAQPGPGSSASVTLVRLPGAGHVWPALDVPSAAPATRTGFSATALVVRVATTVRRH